jgi:hypothetical protein
MISHAVTRPLPALQPIAAAAAPCSDLCAAVLQGVRDAAAASTSAYGRGELQALGLMLAQRSQAFAGAFAAALDQQPAAPGVSTMPSRTASNAMALELVEDRQVEQDMEVMRAVQRIRDAAEWEMREHRSLLASLPPNERGLLVNTPEPSACARALLRAFEQLGLDHADRLRLMRASSDAVAAWFREHHAQQVRRLRERGVVAAPFTVIVGGAAAVSPQRSRPVPRASGQPEAALRAVPAPRAPAQAQVAAPVGLGLLLQCLQTRSSADLRYDAPNPQEASQQVLADKLWRLLRGSTAPGAEPVRGVPIEELPRATQFHLPDPSRPKLPAGFQQSVLRRQFEAALRRQIREQLRGCHVQRSLRHFLLAPWVHALAETLLQHGPDAPLTHRIFESSDDLIGRIARPGTGTGDLEPLLQTVEEALGLTLLPSERVRALRGLLGDLLSQGPAAQEAAGGEQNEERWIETLAPGQWFQLQIDSQWITAELLWSSTNQQFFLFRSQHAGRSHSMSRRALLQMKAQGRVEGLASTSQAMQ